VLIGPGGAGKGTLAAELVAEDPTLWLSRSWTTRPPRPGERERNSYEFVDRTTFTEAVERGEFFEWAEFLGNLMGTPIPRPPEGADVLLEIDVQGAEQVLAKRPDATVILLLPPSVEAQAARLAARGDDEEHIARRVATHTVVNDDLRQARGELAAIVDRTRTAALRAATPEDT
jgi:guanylate kinase